MENEDCEVLRQHIESLGIDKLESLGRADKAALIESLSDADEDTLANHIKRFNESELYDFIHETLYSE